MEASRFSTNGYKTLAMPDCAQLASFINAARQEINANRTKFFVLFSKG